MGESEGGSTSKNASGEGHLNGIGSLISIFISFGPMGLFGCGLNSYLKWSCLLPRRRLCLISFA